MKSKIFRHLFTGTLTNWLIVTLALAQTPNSFKYQAILRDASGFLRVNATVNVRVDILQSSITGTNVYGETFSAQSNSFGLINLEIGNGTLVSGNFSTIDWSAGPYFIKISIDGVEMGTSQLLSVPYALYAAKAANGFSGSYADLTNKPTLATVAGSGSYTDLTNKPTLFNGNYNNLINKPTIVTSSTFSIASGIDALNDPTKGSFNTAYGQSALSNNTSGQSNTSVGFSSLTANTSGTNNTAIGVFSLYSDTSGWFNTAVGASSLYSNITGHGNTAIGFTSMNKNTTGAYNTAIGTSALNSNTTGYSNVAIGNNSLSYNTTGDYNIAIGYQANVGAQNLTNATVIGNNVTVSASNTMVFGNSSIVGWGFGAAPGSAAIRVGSSSSNGNGATLTLAGVWTNASDSTKKFNIHPIHYGLNEILKLRPVAYQMKGSGSHDIGFIAQEVKSVLPEIAYGSEGEMTLSYGQITAVLTKAMQEQQKQITDQQKQIDELKKMVESLKK